MKIRNNSLSNRSIDIDISEGVSVHLYQHEYDELCRLLCADMKEEIESAHKFDKRATELREQCWHLTKDLRELFYDCDCDIALFKGIDDVPEDKLKEVLEKYSKLLGFV